MLNGILAAEAKLEKGFGDQSAAYLANGGADLRYLAFDFHKECGAKNYHRLSILWDQVGFHCRCWWRRGTLAVVGLKPAWDLDL